MRPEYANSAFDHQPDDEGHYTPAYRFAGNMKHLYLTFAATRRFDYDNGYLSTDGKVIRLRSAARLQKR